MFSTNFICWVKLGLYIHLSKKLAAVLDKANKKIIFSEYYIVSLNLNLNLKITHYCFMTNSLFYLFCNIFSV